jgi:hypothetical protein
MPRSTDEFLRDENPYSPPDYYANRPRNSIPWTAYVVVAGTIISGAALTGFGFYNLLAATTLAGLFWLSVGATGAYYIVYYSRRPS